MKSLKVLAEVVLVAVLVACGGSEKGGGEKSGGEKGGPPASRPGPNAASKAADEIPTKDRKEMYLDRYRFGIATDADGIVGKDGDWIAPGSTLFISLDVR